MKNLVDSKLLYKSSNRTFVSLPGTKFRNGNSNTSYCKTCGSIFENLISQHKILTGAVFSLLSLISVSSCHLINCLLYVHMKRPLYGPKQSEHYDQQISLIIRFFWRFVVTDFNMKFGSTQQFSYWQSQHSLHTRPSLYFVKEGPPSQSNSKISTKVLVVVPCMLIVLST